MAISTSHRVPLLRGRIISQRDARSGLDVGGSCRVPSPSWSDQSTATGSRCDRKIKPVTLRQNQTAAESPKRLLQQNRSKTEVCPPAQHVRSTLRSRHCQTTRPSPVRAVIFVVPTWRMNGRFAPGAVERPTSFYAIYYQSANRRLHSAFCQRRLFSNPLLCSRATGGTARRSFGFSATWSL